MCVCLCVFILLRTTHNSCPLLNRFLVAGPRHERLLKHLAYRPFTPSRLEAGADNSGGGANGGAVTASTGPRFRCAPHPIRRVPRTWRGPIARRTTWRGAIRVSRSTWRREPRGAGERGGCSGSAPEFPRRVAGRWWRGGRGGGGARKTTKVGGGPRGSLHATRFDLLLAETGRDVTYNWRGWCASATLRARRARPRPHRAHRSFYGDACRSAVIQRTRFSISGTDGQKFILSYTIIVKVEGKKYVNYLKKLKLLF